MADKNQQPEAPPLSDEQLRSLLDEISTVMHEGEDWLQRAVPRPPQLVGPLKLIAALYVGCFTVYRAIGILIHQGFQEEALTLSRTLLEDCTTLEYFNLNKDQLDLMEVKYVFLSLQDEIALEREAIKAGFVENDEHLRGLEADSQSWEERAKSLGMTKFGGLPSLRDRMRELSSEGSYWKYMRFSHSAHTTRVALEARQRVERSGLVIGAVASFPTLHTTALDATNRIFGAYRATCKILDWPRDMKDEVKNYFGVFNKLRDIGLRARLTDLPAELRLEEFLPPSQPEDSSRS